MKATEQYFPVVLFIMLYKVVLTFGAVNDIRKCKIFFTYDHHFPCTWRYLLMSLVKMTITVAIHMNSDITAKCLSANHCSTADRMHTAAVYWSCNLEKH